MKKIVVKFGGSSLAGAAQFEKAGNIIRQDSARRYVVPSAPGKRFEDDRKVTDMLYGCYALAEEGKVFDKELKAIEERYQEIVDGLGLAFSLKEEFDIIKSRFTQKAGVSYAASRGEYLNGRIMAEYLGYAFVDAADVIRFDKQGNFLPEETNVLLKNRLEETGHAVVPGFYGADETGSIHTFSRGGSDITGSLVAKAAQVDLYENWTDVSGFLVADPRIIHEPQVISMITYRELRELSYMGATVLHEEAVFPVRKEGIPINIRNTNAPHEKGTMIVANTSIQPEYTITGIAGKRGFTAFNIEKDMMNSEVGFGKKVLGVFADRGIEVEHVPSGIDTMTVFVHEEDVAGKEEAIIKELYEVTASDQIELDKNLGLIAIVGRGMKANKGTAGRVFSALAHAHVNVRMIDQGSSELNIIIGVENDEFNIAVKALYDIFVTVHL